MFLSSVVMLSQLEAKSSALFRRSWLMDGSNSLMLKQMKMKCCLFLIGLNQLIMAVVVFHWLKLRFFGSRIFLLILPILDFMGLMILQVGLFEKFRLWSLSILNC